MLRTILVLLLLPVAVMADALPLFDSDDTLHLTIEAPMHTLISDAAERRWEHCYGAGPDVDARQIAFDRVPFSAVVAIGQE